MIIREKTIKYGKFHKPIQLEENAVIIDTTFDYQRFIWSVIYYIKEKRPRPEPKPTPDDERPKGKKTQKKY